MFNQNSGTTTLTGANTYTGGTVITGGLLVANTTSLPAGQSVAIGAGGALTLDQATAASFGGILSGLGTVTKQGAGTLTLTGANTFTGGTTVSAGNLIANTSSLPGNVALAASTGLILDQATTGTYSGVVSGAGSLEKRGVGALTLTGANTHTGGTTVNAGSLALAGSGKLGASTSALAVNAATLDLGATTQSAGAVTLAGGTIRNGTLNGTSYASSGGTVSANLGGTGAVFNQNSGTTTLTGANTYTGGTVITGGLLVANTTSLPAGQSVAIGAGGALTLDQATAASFGGILSGLGTVTKQGAGTLTLTGANTFTGGTTVSAGNLIANTSSLPGNVALTASTGLVFDQATTGIYSGVVSGPGSLEKRGVGALTLTGANTYTGGTTVNAGSLALAGSGKLGASTSALAVNAATLDLGATTQSAGAVTLAGGTIANGTLNGTSYASSGGTVSANLGGTGAVFNQNSGTTTLTGANTYTGGTVITGGILVANAAALPADQSVAIGAEGTLALLQDTTATFAGPITGTGLIRKQGTGALTLAQTSPAKLNVEAGSLFLRGDIGATTVSSGAFLGGTGTVTGNLVNQGTVSPGFSPGTMLVGGNFSQTNTGTLIIEIASATSFDKLIVAGTASLGGTLQINTLGGYDPVGQSFVVLTAVGGVSGTFSPITGTAAVSATVSYNPNNVSVAFTQIPFAVFALTPNQIAAAAAAQNSPALTAALNAIPLASQVPASLNAISPQGYEIWSDIAFARATAIANRYNHEQGLLPEHGRFYFDAGQRRGRARGDLDVGRTTFNSDSGLVGYNGSINPNLVVGGLFNYEDSTASLGFPGSRTEVESYLLGVRAAWRQEAWFLHGLVAYGYDDYVSKRPVVFPGTSAVAKSNAHGNHWLADVSGGRDFDTGLVTFSPFVGLLAGGWDANQFTETGAGIYNASLRDQSARTLQSQAGLAVELNTRVGSVALRPHVRAAWLHEYSNNARAVDAAFGTIDYTVMTRNPQRNSALLSAGLDLELSPRVLLYTDISTQTGDRVRALREWRAGVSIGF